MTDSNSAEYDRENPPNDRVRRQVSGIIGHLDKLTVFGEIDDAEREALQEKLIDVEVVIQDGYDREDGRASKQEDSLANPMRFSIDYGRKIDLAGKLRHPDFQEKQATEMEIRGDQLYVHWEWSDDE